MSDRGLQPGTYSVRLAAGPSPLVGVDLRGVIHQPVVTDAFFRVWVVTKDADGTYILAVNDVEGNLFAKTEGEDVFASKGTQARWTVSGPEGGPYTIQEYGFSPLKYWTVENPADSKSLVVLRPLQNPAPENQKWYFVPSQLQAE